MLELIGWLILGGWTTSAPAPADHFQAALPPKEKTPAPSR